MRARLYEFLEDRKSGKNKSKLKGGHDLLNLFLQNREIFTDDFIVDEMFDFFLAGMVTT